MNNLVKSLLRISVILALLTAPSHSHATTNKSPSNQVTFKQIAEIKHKAITEASGIAVSRVQKDVFWLLNDSGDGNVLYAINAKGKLIGQVKIKGVKNKDWEDMASFEYEGKPYLLIADVGDNKAKRNKVKLYIIKEPNTKHLSKKEYYSVKPEWSIKFHYEDGARDSESVAVDVKNKKIYLLSKRDQTPTLYELPLQSEPSKQKAIAQKVTEINLDRSTLYHDIIDFKHLAFLGKPTAMDIAADGRSALVLTYTHAYYFSVKPFAAGKSLFETKPQIFALPYLEQAEAICFDRDGKNGFVTSEGSRTPLFKIGLPVH